ncbi:hypothetical protein HELRODRAFT_180982 [Helobdella robusta]|uniref:Uncharacterized protein n=1 Tax=Helobdella robusta TaxID=6412 RepID=T1FGH7_HELRO|nr:hypothetical protein HELRODRAFT_180982 [Helobdella robusta]ESN93443.1 hypothetical protein HELRODRAFT_180982 [Helobdella robusta]
MARRISRTILKFCMKITERVERKCISFETLLIYTCHHVAAFPPFQDFNVSCFGASVICKYEKRKSNNNNNNINYNNINKNNSNNNKVANEGRLLQNGNIINDQKMIKKMFLTKEPLQNEISRKVHTKELSMRRKTGPYQSKEECMDLVINDLSELSERPLEAGEILLQVLEILEKN